MPMVPLSTREMEAVYALTRLKNIELFLPSPSSGLFFLRGYSNDTEMREMLEHPADFIDSERFFSWESFFTDALIQKLWTPILLIARRNSTANT